MWELRTAVRELRTAVESERGFLQEGTVRPMDAQIVERLKEAGIWSGINVREELMEIHVPIAVDDHQKVVGLGDEVPVNAQEKIVMVRPRPVRDLFVGNRQPPTMAGDYLEAFVPFFFMLERAAADYCSVRGQPVYDMEFESLYAELRRRPDGRNPHALFSYLRAASQVYLSLTDTSEDEFNAVVGKLLSSVRTWKGHATSTNYWNRVLKQFVQGPKPGFARA